MSAMWMQTTSLEMIVPSVAIAGFASHLLYYIRGEHHLNASLLFYIYITLAAAILVYHFQINDYAFIEAGQNTSVIIAVYALPLFASIIIYRVFFHRLSSFPGPFLARISKLWHVYHVRYSQNHQFLNNLHKQYGPFVRTGK